MSPDSIDRAACPLNSSIPHPRVVFHNTRSLSLYADEYKEHARYKGAIRHLASLCKSYDIICLQETHAATDEKTALCTEFGQTHLIFYSNLDRGRAGVITLVNRRSASGFETSQLPLDACLDGRALVLSFTSRMWPGRLSLVPTFIFLQATSLLSGCSSLKYLNLS